MRASLLTRIRFPCRCPTPRWANTSPTLAVRPRPAVSHPRATNRASLQLGAALPFTGVDLWNAYELSWLDARGKPRVAMATFSFPADSPNIVESKSFKLYLNSFNQTRLPNAQALRDRLGATWPPPPARPWGWSSSARSALAN